MSDYVPIDRARTMPGLKLVATPGVPNPWTEAARGILHVKRLDHIRVAQHAGEANEALVAWTGINSAPILIHGDTPPRSGWIEILLLADGNFLLFAHQRDLALAGGRVGGARRRRNDERQSHQDKA